MTTIAYDGRYIVADGLCKMDSTIVSDSVEKFYYRDDLMFALCGTTQHCHEFANDFEALKSPSNKYLDAGGFLFENEEVFLVFVCPDNNVFVKNRMIGDIWADGSGRDWAIAAMDHGKTAIEAVQYAATRDIGTGGQLKCFDTHTKKFIKVK